jgi:CheY-like chemotaxis protein
MTKILVIDDESPVRNVVGSLLRQAGHDVIDAEHGLNEIAMAQSEVPDLILLDLMMPVVDGFEVLRRLGEDPVSRRIPVIVLTAQVDSASERRCMELGAVDYIKKPWGPQEIEDRVAMALGYPELAKPNETALGQPTEQPVKAPINRVDNRLNHIVEEPQEPAPPVESDEPEEPSLARFKTKEFRIRGDEVDNSYLA